jgi:tetratricopeptide (TPR) repeat protein
LLSARVSLQAGKPKEALPRLEALVTRHKLAENQPQALRARLAQAECLLATGDLPGAKGRLEKVVNLTADRDLKAAAYNTLGVCHLQGNQLKDALWAFLWVEVEYNQNKEEHARALYYLVQVFSRLDRPTRAEACLQALLGDPLLADTVYQKKAAAEKK